ncbi:MAG: DASS family sodium-coupled anion symporter [Bacteroidia bacterium]
MAFARVLRDKKNLKLFFSIILPLILLILPASAFGIEGLTVIQQRVIALFALAALFWVLEPIPIFATSILLITLELVMISDSSFLPFRGEATAEFGNAMSYHEIMDTFASPVILLFLGGFFLAAAATKYRLDQNIAGVLLRYFGEKPHWVLLGLMSITAVFSMFMSNTATTAMMLSILIPVLSIFPPKDPARTAFVLGIPVAANLGGIGTPIGTPANAIALKFLASSHISFGTWMAFGVPIVILMLLFAWLLLVLFYRTPTQQIRLNIPVSFVKTPKAVIVYVTFLLTVFLWLTDFLHGMNAYVVGLIPVSIFLATGIINKEDLKVISWDVLWLVSGGIALGLALTKTGLAQAVIDSISLDSMSPVAIFMAACLMGMLLANFMSHTATANLILPLLAGLGASVASLASVGGTELIIIGTTISTSLAMSLPISTPPNALAHATGLIQTKDLARVGILIGITGIIIVGLTMYILHTSHFLS